MFGRKTPENTWKGDYCRSIKEEYRIKEGKKGQLKFDLKMVSKEFFAN